MRSLRFSNGSFTRACHSADARAPRRHQKPGGRTADIGDEAVDDPPGVLGLYLIATNSSYPARAIITRRKCRRTTIFTIVAVRRHAPNSLTSPRSSRGSARTHGSSGGRSSPWRHHGAPSLVSSPNPPQAASGSRSRSGKTEQGARSPLAMLTGILAEKD
jgi:hypothetical protein